MQAVLNCTHTTIISAARPCNRPALGAISLGALTPARGCQLGCGASARPFSKGCAGRAPGRLGRRGAVVCHAAAKNFYEILGISQSASDRDIKSAYRKLAMKLHPDVNKAPDAQKRFMEVKVAYETLSEPKQRAEYDRRLRMGYSSGGSAGSRAGSGGFGGASTSGGWGPYGPYGTGPSYNQEPMPGLDDLVRELEKEFTAWANSRGQGARAKSLMEELEDLGGEFLDFLEDALGIKDEPPAAGASGAQRGGQQAGGPAAGPGADGREPRTAAERFDAFWQQYGDGSPFGAGAGAAAGGGSAASSGRNSGSAAGAGTGGRATSSSSSTSTPRSSSSTVPPKPPPRSADDDIEAQLMALKKKLNKL